MVDLTLICVLLVFTHFAFDLADSNNSSENLYTMVNSGPGNRTNVRCLKYMLCTVLDCTPYKMLDVHVHINLLKNTVTTRKETVFVSLCYHIRFELF